MHLTWSARLERTECPNFIKWHALSNGKYASFLQANLVVHLAEPPERQFPNPFGRIEAEPGASLMSRSNCRYVPARLIGFFNSNSHRVLLECIHGVRYVPISKSENEIMRDLQVLLVIEQMRIQRRACSARETAGIGDARGG